MQISSSTSPAANQTMTEVQSKEAKADALKMKMAKEAVAEAGEMADESRASQGVGTKVNITA